MTGRGPVTRCSVRGCPVIFHGQPGDLCPVHRDPRSPEGRQERQRVGIDLPPISMQADDE